MDATTFAIRGEPGRWPIVLSVPHAGRHYGALATQLRVPISTARPLEDRHADAIAEAAFAVGVAGVVAHAPRLMIDLNRDEGDLDPAMVAGPLHHGAPVSLRARGGLGLIPARLGTTGPLWRERLHPDDVAQRIDRVHRPYHAALSRLLTLAQARHGTAILIDLHSMPPLPEGEGIDIVIGDRFGTSAHDRITAAAEAFLSGARLGVARNTPYSGGAIIRRHARPAQGIHAIQIECDRRLYLDDALDAPGPGLARMQTVLTGLINALSAEISGSTAIAAE